jgi:UDP-N-acetylmuramoyl-tripeptide--D-alanyl-D-alanine ligase
MEEQKFIADVLGRLERMEIRGISIDSRNIRQGELFVALKGDRFDGHDFVPDAIRKGAWGALVERNSLEKQYANLGNLKNILPVEDTLYALQEMSLTHRKKFSIPVVGITGSNGKTTTKEMLAAILATKGAVLKNEGNLNNHIGVPLTLLKLHAEHRSAVIEMGMSAIGEIDLLARLTRPTVGVITNIGPAHLEFLGSMDRVADAKSELLLNLDRDATAVLNADDGYYENLRTRMHGRVIAFGIANKADVIASDIRQSDDHVDFMLRMDNTSSIVRLRTVGIHNIYNALAAASAALALEAPVDAIRNGLEDFVPVAMRSEVKIVQGRTILADYYNANPASMEAAIRSLASLARDRKAIAVLGDMLELGSFAVEAHQNIGRIAAQEAVDCLIAIGTFSGQTIQGALRAGMPHDCVIEASTRGEAARLIMKLSSPGDVVLIKGSRGMKMEKILEEF